MGLHIVQIAIYAIVFGIIAYVAGTKYIKYSQSGDTLTERELVSLIGQVAGLLVLGFIVVQSFTYVEQGYGCIVIDPLLNRKTVTLGETFFFRLPWTRTVYMYYATLSTEMITNEDGTTGEFPAVKVLSKDGLDIEVDVLIRYELDPLKLIALYESYPDLAYERKAVSSVTREDIRDVISGYETLQIVEERQAISQDMTQTILTSLNYEPSLHSALVNVEVDLRDIDPPQSFKVAVQNKKTAEQAKLTAEHEREKLLIQADAKRQESIKLAEGEATAMEIRANATRRALSTIGEELDTDVYYSLQMLKEIAPNVKFLILNSGEDGVPLYYQVPTETP
jgi:regulator of protease activity HflC (stomatin/prohibitin superfamily)